MRRIVFSVALALAVLASTTGSEAQSIESIGSSSPDDFLKSVQARKAELAANTSVPDSEVILYNELGRLQTEIQAVSKAQTTVFPEVPKDSQQNIAKYSQDLNKANSDISKIDCKDAGKYKDAADSFNRAIRALQTYWPSANGSLAGADPNCEATKARFNETEHNNELKSFLETYNSAFAQYEKDYDNDVPAAKSLVDELKKRIGVLQDKLNSRSSQQQISGSLPWILSILGAVGVLTILGIKLFDPPEQMEWIASGQVTQFVTILVLLSVIVALGLSNILHENTLGTLLGGIAGYVLAQGVGRAAAHAQGSGQGGGAGQRQGGGAGQGQGGGAGQGQGSGAGQGQGGGAGQGQGGGAGQGQGGGAGQGQGGGAGQGQGGGAGQGQGGGAGQGQDGGAGQGQGGAAGQGR